MSVPDFPRDLPLAAELRPLSSAESQQTSRLAEPIKEDGTVDIDAIYRMGRVPEARITAEAIHRALTSLPPDIPDRVRREALKGTLIALGQTSSIHTQEIIADANLKSKRLDQYLVSLTTEIDARTTVLCSEVQELEAEMERLEAELTAHRAAIDRNRTIREAATRGCGERIAALEDVARFLSDQNA